MANSIHKTIDFIVGPNVTSKRQVAFTGDSAIGKQLLKGRRKWEKKNAPKPGLGYGMFAFQMGQAAAGAVADLVFPKSNIDNTDYQLKQATSQLGVNAKSFEELAPEATNRMKITEIASMVPIVGAFAPQIAGTVDKIENMASEAYSMNKTAERKAVTDQLDIASVNNGLSSVSNNKFNAF